MSNLNETTFSGGGDCHEMSLTALEAGIKYGLSKSIVYVITDAPAKDHIKYKDTIELIKKKESTVR